MKPRPTTIQPGATHWNPKSSHTVADWYKYQDDGWFYFEELGSVWLPSSISWDSLNNLIPVEELMAQPPEWKGEGLPPFGVDCKITTRTILGACEYEGVGMFIAQTMDYYVMLMQNDRTPWVRSKDRVTFYPIKSEREKAIDDIKSLITKSCGLTEHRIQIIATALFDAGYRKVEK